LYSVNLTKEVRKSLNLLVVWFSSGLIAASKEVILEVILFISITFRRASERALSLTFGRIAMRRWDRLLDSYVEEYRARGVSPQCA
jgi:hypothetical protein